MLLINYYLNRFKSFISDVKGQGMVEYALIIGLIALVVIIAMQAFGAGLVAKFTEITGELAAAGN